MIPEAASAYEFGPFRLEPGRRRLVRDGDALALTPKAFDTLLLLVQNHERVVEKDEALRSLWPDSHVEESSLSQNIFMLRKTLGDSPEGARFIATVPRRGYRFVAEVREVGELVDGNVPEARGRPWVKPLALFAAAAALGVAGFVAGRLTSPSAEPELKRLTFRRGIAYAGRFTPDGSTIVYSAAWDDSRETVYITRPESPESQETDLRHARILSVSARGEMAVLLGPRPLHQYELATGTLARVPLTGGVPRPVLDEVEAADFGPDGESLAVVRKVDNRIKRLEYPIGTVLVEAVPSDCLGSPRVAPSGEYVAFLSCPGAGRPPQIAVVDRAGKRRTLLSQSWVDSLAWSPDGRELLFTIGVAGLKPELHALSLDGRLRRLGRLPGLLLDVSRAGRLLVVIGNPRAGIIGVAPGETEERDLSWFEGSSAVELSADGRLMLFGEVLEGGGARGRIYLRRTDGSPALHLGDGFPLALAPDGSAALVRSRDANELTLLPTGPGVPRRIDVGRLEVYSARFFPDGRRLLLGGFPRDEPPAGRLWVSNVEGEVPRPITPPQTGVGILSPDGRDVLSIGHDGAFLYPVEPGERRRPNGVAADEWPIQWSADGRYVWVRRQGELPVEVVRVELATGRREPWRTLIPQDPVGINFVQPLIAARAENYVYTYQRVLSDLYLVEPLP